MVNSIGCVKIDIGIDEKPTRIAVDRESQRIWQKILRCIRIQNCGHGCINISEGERGADETALASHKTIVVALEKALDGVEGLTDPMTHTLIDGVLRAERDESMTIEHRLTVTSDVPGR